MANRHHHAGFGRGQSADDLNGMDEFDDEGSDRFSDYNPDRFNRRQIAPELQRIR